jgi:hypothetical protein
VSINVRALRRRQRKCAQNELAADAARVNEKKNEREFSSAHNVNSHAAVRRSDEKGAGCGQKRLFSLTLALHLSQGSFFSVTFRVMRRVEKFF